MINTNTTKHFPYMVCLLNQRYKKWKYDLLFQKMEQLGAEWLAIIKEN